MSTEYAWCSRQRCTRSAGSNALRVHTCALRAGVRALRAGRRARPRGMWALRVGQTALPVASDAPHVETNALPFATHARRVRSNALRVDTKALRVGRRARPVGRHALPVRMKALHAHCVHLPTQWKSRRSARCARGTACTGRRFFHRASRDTLQRSSATSRLPSATITHVHFGQSPFAPSLTPPNNGGTSTSAISTYGANIRSLCTPNASGLRGGPAAPIRPGEMTYA